LIHFPNALICGTIRKGTTTKTVSFTSNEFTVIGFP
jgi:hypothetical protein